MGEDPPTRADALPSLTVVVCCSEDTDVIHTLDSIDDEVDVVATITPDPLIEEFLTTRGIPFAITPRGNHAVTTNAGIALARTDAVLIVDSDTVLEPGVVRRTREALAHHRVVNLRIGFAATDTASSRAAAALRTFDNTYDQPAYKPGIAFALDLVGDIGGHWYDPRVAWPCDAELLNRLRAADIEVHHLPGPGIVHRPVPVGHLLRAYFHYGKGDARQMLEIGHPTHWWPVSNLAFRYRSALAEADDLDAARWISLLVVVDAASLAGIATESWSLARRREPARPVGPRRVPVPVREP